MSSTIIRDIEKAQMKAEVPTFEVGDTVRVAAAILEGKKKRVQRFEGTVIKRSGHLSRQSFTVRRIIDKIGVERTFLLHSPLVEEIEVIKRGAVRRARLYYLRDRVGAKANRVKSKD